MEELNQTNNRNFQEAPKSNLLAVSNKEKLLAVAMYGLAFIYYSAVCEMGIAIQILLGIFVALFLVYGEVMFWEKKRSVESILFLVFVIMIGVARIFEIGSVWDNAAKTFFLHLYAVYWVMSRSNCLAEGKTSHLFAWDGLNGFVVMPFGNFHLFTKSIASIFSGKTKKNGKRVAISVFASVIGIILFVIAMSFLKDSDANFAAMMKYINIKWDFEFIVRCIVSFFVASYLFGLFDGCLKTGSERAQKIGESMNGLLDSLRKVPSLVWTAFIGLFSVFYVLFFVLQGSYMLDAFSMLLPEKFTFSEYARKGFGDMCAVMVVNFVLMWFAGRTAEVQNKLLRIFETILMGESLMFALIAFLKLFMYIQAYGFTPLRLQSVWLVIVLSYACICILIHMYTEKKTAKAWFIGSAATLTVLALV